MWPRTSTGVSTVTRNIPAEGEITNGGIDAIGEIGVEWSDGLSKLALSPRERAKALISERNSSSVVTEL